MAGTITKRGNSYRLKVNMDTDYKGRPIQYTKTVHCNNEKQAEKEMALFYTDCVRNNISANSNVTISELCDKWLSLCMENNIKNATYVSYSSIIKTSIKPNLGDYKIGKIKVIDIQEWVKDISENHKPKTVQNHFTVLNSIMERALIWDYIQKNPCQKVTLPKIKKEEAKYLNKVQVKDLLTLVEKESAKHRAIVILTLFTGIRMGELAGLKWDCVHDGYIEIKEVRIYRPGFGVYIDTPKTEKSKRKISIPIECYNLLNEVKLEQRKNKLTLGSKWEDTDYVISGQFGGAIFPPRISQWWREFCDTNNVERVTFHQLRHTHTSMLASMDLDHIQISRRLGHSQLSTTMNIYTHLFENLDNKISSELSNEYWNDSYQNRTISKGK